MHLQTQPNNLRPCFLEAVIQKVAKTTFHTEIQKIKKEKSKIHKRRVFVQLQRLTW